jgi:hypothetical protein
MISGNVSRQEGESIETGPMMAARAKEMIDSLFEQ